MALSESALCLVADVETELGLTAGAETRLDGWIGVASAMISLYLRGKEDKLHRQTVTDARGGDGGTRLILSVTPIVSVTSVAYADDTIASTNYEIEDAAAGILFFSAGTTNTASRRGGTIAQDALVGTEWALYDVVYSGGWVTPQQVVLATFATLTLPVTIRRACVELVAWMYNNPGGAAGEVASESLLSHSVSYRAQAAVDDAEGCGIPAPIRQKIRQYRFVDP